MGGRLISRKAEHAVRELLASETLRRIVWVALGVVLLPAVATLVVGILVLVLAPGTVGLSLGVLAIVFAVFILSGSVVTLVMMRRARRQALLETEFIGRVSHEIRTPLAAVRMHVDSLKAGRFRSREEEQECIMDLDRDMSRLEGVLERLLRFREVASEGLFSAAEPVRVRELAAVVVGRFPEPLRRHVRVDEGGDGAVAMMDREALETVVEQLVQNALDHGAPPVIVSVREKTDFVGLAVRDHGPGFDHREAKKLFKPFHRGERRTRVGLGLGLPFVKRVVEDAGGWVDVTSEPGQGSCFTVWLPEAGQGRKPRTTK